MVGSGVFKKASVMSAYLGSGNLVLLCWVLAGLVTLVGALANAEIAGLIAEPGGQYVYFKRMYGRAFAFFYGWSSFTVIQSATAASVAYVFAESISVVLPVPELLSGWAEIKIFGIFTPFANFSIKAITISLLLFLGTINHLGVKYGGRLSSVMASSVVLCIILVVVACFGFSDGNAGNWFQQSEPVPAEQPLFGTGFFGLFFAAMMAAFWAYEGWNNIGFLGGEIRNPLRNIPLALIGGTLFVMLLYTLANAAFLYVLPAGTLAGVGEGQIAAVEVVRSFMGSKGAILISVLIVFSTFNSTNTTILSAPRVCFAMAKDGLFFKGIEKVHPKYKSPSNALFLQVGWASVLVLSGSFDDLTDMLIFAAFIFYGAGALGVIVMRRKWPDVPRPFKVPLYPWLPLAFALFCLCLVVVSIAEHPKNALIGLSLMGAGLPFWLYWRKNKAAEEETQTEKSESDA
jgi:basic amino acid/polyamine antiporter, APA family